MRAHSNLSTINERTRENGSREAFSLHKHKNNRKILPVRRHSLLSSARLRVSTKTWNDLKPPTTIYNYLKNFNNHLKNIYSHSQTI